MEIKTTIDLQKTLKRIESLRISNSDRKKALGRAALGQVRSIKTRTAKGIGLDGYGFKNYSYEYLRFKRDTGHDSGFINLVYSGRMLADMGVTKSTPFEATVSFHRSTERKKAEANQKLRPFMGITDDEQKLIVKRFKRALFK